MAEVEDLQRLSSNWASSLIVCRALTNIYVRIWNSFPKHIRLVSSSRASSLRRILHIHWTDFVSNDVVVRSCMGQPLLSGTIRQRRLSFFGHLCRADTGQDHSRALRACIRVPLKDWRQRTGRPRQTWLRTVEDDLRPLNFGLATARRRAMDRPAWRLLVDVATSS